MKIAVPTHNTDVDSHFGHCEAFTVFTVSDKKEILARETVASPAGCGCKSNIARTLALMGVEIMLAGNMGDGAVNVLTNSGISVVRGCSGDVKEVVQRWLDGKAVDSGIGCHAHEHGCN